MSRSHTHRPSSSRVAIVRRRATLNHSLLNVVPKHTFYQEISQGEDPCDIAFEKSTERTPTFEPAVHSSPHGKCRRCHQADDSADSEDSTRGEHVFAHRQSVIEARARKLRRVLAGTWLHMETKRASCVTLLSGDTLQASFCCLGRQPDSWRASGAGPVAVSSSAKQAQNQGTNPRSGGFQPKDW